MSDTEVRNYTDFHVSIELNSEIASFLLIDKSTKKPIAIESISIKDSSLSKEIAKSEIIEKTTPNSMSCVVNNSNFTLVPSSIFQEENKDNYLNFSTPSVDNMVIVEDKLTKHDIVNCFGIDLDTKNTLSNLFPPIQFKHIGSILADSLANGLHVNFSSEKEFEIVFINNKNLLFFNKFSAENTEETLYYLSLVAEKHKLDIQNTSIKLSGVVDKKGEIIAFWSQFIPKENLTFNSIETTQLNAVSTHRFFTLHKQYQCVS